MGWDGMRMRVMVRSFRSWVMAGDMGKIVVWERYDTRWVISSLGAGVVVWNETE